MVTARVVAALALALAACSYHDSFSDCTVTCTAETGCPDGLTCSAEGLCRAAGATAACSPDAGVDAPVVAPLCIGSGAFTICAMATPPATLVLPTTIFTSSGSGFTVDPNCLGNAYWRWQGAGRPDACVMFAQDVNAGLGPTKIHVFGARPLVILATGSITIATSQLLDVASHAAAAHSGPGAASGACASFTALPHSDITSVGGASGGGAGGTFATGLGGSGGGGDSGNSGSTGGGAATSVITTTMLIAGCSGQTSPGNADSASAPGGAGGGALYLAAQGTITIAGTINASGAGGGGGGYKTGGGGGGAGGMIVIDAPTIAATGTIVANGGGGAAGGFWVTPCTIYQNGTPGADPNPAQPTTPAPGGLATPAAGGGNGYAIGQAATPGMAGGGGTGGGDDGGGGGGGGGGLIVAPATTLSGAIVSPPPVTTGL